MVARRAQTQGVGWRPVDDSERIRGRIQGGGTRRGWGRNKCVGCCGRKVGRLGAPDARNERQEGTGDPERPDAKSGRYSSGSVLCPSGEKAFFPVVSTLLYRYQHFNYLYSSKYYI